MITENTTTEKTANQLYRESGSSLLFTEWLEREKLKGTFLKNDTLAGVLEEARTDLDRSIAPRMDNSKIFGVSKNALIASVIIIAAAVAIRYYKKNN